MTRREALTALLCVPQLTRRGEAPLERQLTMVFPFSAKVNFADHEMERGVPRGMGYVTLVFTSEPKGTAVTVMGDMDLPVMQFLRQVRNKTVRCEIAA